MKGPSVSKILVRCRLFMLHVICQKTMFKFNRVINWLFPEFVEGTVYCLLF